MGRETAAISGPLQWQVSYHFTDYNWFDGWQRKQRREIVLRRQWVIALDPIWLQLLRNILIVLLFLSVLFLVLFLVLLLLLLLLCCCRRRRRRRCYDNRGRRRKYKRVLKYVPLPRIDHMKAYCGRSKHHLIYSQFLLKM